MRQFLFGLFILGLLSADLVYAGDYYTTDFAVPSSVRQFSVNPLKPHSYEQEGCKSFAEEIKLERAVVSNALQLSEEQAKCRYEILESNFELMDSKFSALYSEEAKLQDLIKQNADKTAIKTQKRVVKNLKKEIKCIVKKENKKYKNILTSEQRNKLKIIQKLQRQSFENASKQKDYYKLNPKMRPFAPHLVQ